MSKCIVKPVNGRWHCFGPDGQNYCAFDSLHKKWAIECGKANGWEVEVQHDDSCNA